jgi:hypothetical protein
MSRDFHFSKCGALGEEEITTCLNVIGLTQLEFELSPLQHSACGAKALPMTAG